jgi:outer membrane protein
MKLLKIVMASAAMAFSGAVAAAPAATAQGTSVIVIDQARIMRDSAGGKDIMNKIASIEQTIQSELGPIQSSLVSEGQALEAKTANMSREAMVADDQLRAEAEAYAVKAQNFNRQRQVAAAEFQATERAAWTKFFQAMQPVLEEVVAERNADIMLDASDVVWSGESTDATAIVISKMDAALPTVNVVRQKLPTQQQQQ